MANEKPKKDNARGRSKAANRSGTQTLRNKERAAETRQRRLQAAQERKLKNTFVVPLDAVVVLAELPAKERNKLREAFPNDVDEHGHPIVIPDPMRGVQARGKRCGDAVKNREIQFAKIRRKRETRKRLASMSPKERREARAAGDKQFSQTTTQHFMRSAPRRLRGGNESSRPLPRLDLTHILLGS